MQTRVLCMGNELMADDAIGPLVARGLRGLHLPELDVVESAESGLRLLDYLEADRLIIVDAIITGEAAPGTIYTLDPTQLPPACGVSPHFAGLQEALLLGRALGLAVAPQVTILAVEVADCSSVGGPVHPLVEQSIPRVMDAICRDRCPMPSPTSVASGGVS